MMGELEKEEFINRVKGMSKEEMELFAEYVPVEICYNRIGRELKKNKYKLDAIQKVFLEDEE